MAEGFSSYAANAVLNAIGNAAAFSVATPYIQLHTGAPGSAGTSNVAGNAVEEALDIRPQVGLVRHCVGRGDDERRRRLMDVR